MRILLIDEVDVFFGEGFYGNTYNPVAKLQNPELIALFKYIWNNRNNYISFNNLQ